MCMCVCVCVCICVCVCNNTKRLRGLPKSIPSVNVDATSSVIIVTVKLSKLCPMEFPTSQV